MMKNNFFPSIFVCLIFMLSGLTVSGQTCVPGHPEDIVFPDFTYTPPDPGDYLAKLPGGIPVFIAENHEWPTFDIEVTVRTGAICDPKDKIGLTEMVCTLLRDGGTVRLSPEAFEEKLSFMAAELTTSTLADRSLIHLSLLQKDMDQGLALLKEMLEQPGFDEKAIERYRTDLIQNLKRRNDEPSDVERREWALLIYGDHPCTNLLARTDETIGRITRDDLVAHHRKFFRPENYIIAVSCDSSKKEVLKKLADIFPSGGGGKPDTRKLPEEIKPSQPAGVYLIDFPEAKQARVSIGHTGIKEGNPDEYAVTVMNYILGGGGFMSRITLRVRSDEGLSYNQGSSFEPGFPYEGFFRAYFQSNNPNVARGVQIILEELEKIRTDKTGGKELDQAISAIIGQLPSEFSDKFRTVRTFASDYYKERSSDYRKNYEKNISAVTAEDVLKVARKYIRPDRLFILIVGSLEEVKKEWREDALGPIQTLPLRDPLTLK